MVNLWNESEKIWYQIIMLWYENESEKKVLGGNLCNENYVRWCICGLKVKVQKDDIRW